MNMSDIPTTKEEIKKYKIAQKVIRKEARKQTIQEVIAMNMLSTTKQIMWLLIVNGILWIWCSYLLAFMDKVQIAESLSSNVCTVIIGQIVAYFISKTVENVFKFNNIGGPATAVPKSASKMKFNKGVVTNEQEQQTSDFEGEPGDDPDESVPDTGEQFNSGCLD